MLKRLIEKTVNFLGSYALAAVVLVLLAWLTFWGTWEQGRSTLYDVQTRYFESFFVVHWLGDRFPLPMPGGVLLLSLLFLNIVVGGMLRLRKDATRVGIFIVHLGIAFLLLSGLVEHLLSDKGSMTVWEPAGDGRDVSSEFTSGVDWEVAIIRADAGGARTEFIVPESAFDGLSGKDTLHVTHPELPFSLVLSDYMPNANLEPVPPDQPGRGVNGNELKALPPVSAKQQGRINVPGLEARVVERVSGRAQDGLLWGGASNVFAFALGQQRWAIELQRRTWPLPFAIKLDKFVHEVHPGTGMARRFSSYVTLTEMQDGRPTSRKVHITMNEPLRHDGYTLYQSGWGPPPPGSPGRRLYSEFAVVTNPADQWPKYSCYIIAVGLLVHFLRKLYLYLKAEARKRAAAIRSA